MNLFEAKKLLKERGYRLIKEADDITSDPMKYFGKIVDGNMTFDCEYEGTSDYEPGELPCPYVIANLPTDSVDYEWLFDAIEEKFVDSKVGYAGSEVEAVDIIDDEAFEFVFPETDFCDSEQRQEYEQVVRDLIVKALATK